MKVRKAIIPAAGLGTRFLPATKAQPKEMLPIVDKPTIQYIIEEAVASGIEDIIVVTGRNKRSIEDHFDRSIELELELAEPVMDVRGKKIVADKGAVIGFGNAPTGAKYMREFNSQLKAKGFTLSSSDVPCVLKGRLVERKAGNPYQIIVAEAR